MAIDPNTLLPGTLADANEVQLKFDELFTNITDVNIAANAGIQVSKLEALTTGEFIVGTVGGSAVVVTMSGDATVNDAGVVTVSGGTFPSGTLRIADTAGDDYYIFTAGGDLAADRNVILPVLTSDDTFVFEAFAQTLTNKTIDSPSITGTVSGGATYTAPSITSPSITGTVGGPATYNSATLNTPTIGNFTNANHDHSNAANGGNIALAALVGTAGSVIFAGAGGNLTEDNSNFFWDNTNKYLGLGINTPADILHLARNGQLIQIIQDDSGAADEKLWRFRNNAGDFFLETADDSNASPVQAISINRSGTAISVFEIASDSINNTTTQHQITDATNTGFYRKAFALGQTDGSGTDDLFTISLGPDGKMYIEVDWVGWAGSVAFSDGGAVRAFAGRTGGGGAAVTSLENDVGAAPRITILASGNDVIVRATGTGAGGDTRNFSCIIKMYRDN